MPSEICGIRVRRQKPHIENGNIYVGHEWLEILTPEGKIEHSAGFWPTGSIFRSIGVVRIPDPYQNNTADTFSLAIGPIQDRRMKGAGEPSPCPELRACIGGESTNRTNAPGYYSLIWRNCRDWITEVLRSCQLQKRS